MRAKRWKCNWRRARKCRRQLASGIAHDFNNVLTPIIGFADLLLAKIDPPTRPLPIS
jgi:signal transduction histidine kinase